jgi:glycosyltransferase involved in cell wall biosynthesis
MRVLYFIESLRCGGKEKLLIELLNDLSGTLEFECSVVILINSTHYSDQLPQNCKLTILERNRIKKDPKLFYDCYKICKNYKPDLIHVWGNMPAFYSLPASRLLRIPIINSQIADIFGISIKNPFLYFSHKLNFLFAKSITSNSLAGIKSYNVRGPKTKVIYNGLNLEKFYFIPDKQTIKDYYSIRTQYTIIMIGSFSKYKNFDLFVDVACYYQKLKKDITFVAVGEGENFESIKNKIKNLGIGNVILTGRIKDVEQLISACDIGILLSPYGEGVSNAIIEYMAMGKPVIASDKGGNCELIEDNVNGILLSDDNVTEVSKAIDNLMNDDTKRKSMGEINRIKILENFSVKKMSSEFMTEYQKILNN